MIRGWAEFVRQKHALQSAAKKQFELNAQRIEKIKAYSGTKRIRYPEMKEAFDYVHQLYPFANVKQAFVYLIHKHFLFDIGYGGVGGFYDISNRIIVVTDWIEAENTADYANQAEYTIDEVLCHELIHYAANFRVPSSNRNVEEEIAYSKSVGYLRLKGRTDDFIIRKNMMPYLLSVIDRGEISRRVLISNYNEKLLATASIETLNGLMDQHSDDILKIMLDEAYKLGQQVIWLYDERPLEVKQMRRRVLDV